MKSRLIRIGNSRGVRLPKSLIEEAGLSDELELHLDNGTIVIRSAKPARAGWAEAAAEMATTGEDRLPDEVVPTRFDDEEWEW